MKRVIKITEAMIQKGIIDYLTMIQSTDLYFFRSGAGAVKTAGGNYFKTGKKGCPDITVLYKGRFIGIEVKNTKGRQSTVQKEAEHAIIEAGGEYYIARSIADVKRIISPA